VQGESMEILGANVRTVNPQTASNLRIRGGVEITSLGEGKFKQAGIREGFIITSVNRRPMRSAEELKSILNNSKGGIYVEGVYPNGKVSYYAFGI